MVATGQAATSQQLLSALFGIFQDNVASPVGVEFRLITPQNYYLLVPENLDLFKEDEVCGSWGGDE